MGDKPGSHQSKHYPGYIESKDSITSSVKPDSRPPKGTYNTLLDYSHEEQPSFTYGIGGCIDVETTGLSPHDDEVIELALVLFFYNHKTGEIAEMLDEYTGLREPDCSISRGASRVHGLTKRKLKGKDLDKGKILALLKQADFLISHNARFDYSFVTPLFPEVAAKPWYCSMNGINWRGKGFSSKGLQNLLNDHGIEVVQSHRALADARAVVTLLGRCNKKGKPYLSELLKSSPAVDRTFHKVSATTEKRMTERKTSSEIIVSPDPLSKPKSVSCGCLGCLLPLLGISGVLTFVLILLW